MKLSNLSIFGVGFVFFAMTVGSVMAEVVEKIPLVDGSKASVLNYPLRGVMNKYGSLVEQAVAPEKQVIKMNEKEWANLEEAANAIDKAIQASQDRIKALEKELLAQDRTGASKHVENSKKSIAEEQEKLRKLRIEYSDPDRGFFSKHFTREGHDLKNKIRDQEALVKKLDEELIKHEASGKKIDELEQKITQEKEGLKKAKDQAEVSKTRYDEAIKVRNERANFKDMTLEQLKEKFHDDGVLQNLKIVGDKIFEDMSKAHFNAELLFTDLNVIRARNANGALEVMGLKLALENQLSNTLMGQFVNEQIKKAMLKVCEIRKQCNVPPEAATTTLDPKQIEAITDILNQTLYERENSGKTRK